MNALIIEDHKSHSLDVEIILIDCGIENIHKSASIQEAKIQINKKTPDIAVVDLILNEQSGYELIPLLKSLNVYVIILTGVPSFSHIHKSIGLNVDAFLSKPVQENELAFHVFKFKSKKEELRKKDHVFNYENKIVKVEIKNILYLEAEGNYATIHLRDKKMVLKKSMKSIISEINSYDIIQVARNIALNKNQVKVINYSNSKIQTSFGKEFLLGRAFKKDIKAYFNKPQ